MRSCLASKQFLIMTESFAEMEPTACLSQRSQTFDRQRFNFYNFPEGCESTAVINLYFTTDLPTDI